MNPRLFKLLNRNENLYPHLLEEKFPRVFNKLLELWDTEHIDVFLQDLMMDNRAGNRQGFPPDAAMEIIRLGNYLDKLHNKDKESDAWDSVPEYKRHELEQFGYEFNAQGLLKSIEDNNQNAVQVFLSCGVEPNLQSQFGWTPLMQAATRGHLLACAYLILRGADVNLTTTDGWTSLHKAANNGHTQIVKLLLDKGANRFAKYQDDSTPLDLALKAGHLDIVEMINKFNPKKDGPESQSSELSLLPPA